MTESRCHHTDAGPMLNTHAPDCEYGYCPTCDRLDEEERA